MEELQKKLLELISEYGETEVENSFYEVKESLVVAKVLGFFED